MARYPLPVLDTLTEPTLLLNAAQCRENIRAMVKKARQAGVKLRPHFKTHQANAVARWFREEGVDRAAVSSLRMAEYFAKDGWVDLTVAFPVNILEIDIINRLAAKIHLNLLAENPASLRFLQEELHFPAGVFIEIDTGYKRTGISWDKRSVIDEMLQIIPEVGNLTFKGFLAHAGHSYQARSMAAIAQIHETSLAQAGEFKAAYQADYPDLVLSVGDTPTCSVMEQFTGADEIRPGNFAFYDLTQAAIGSCRPEQIAVAMACPVVAKYPERGELVVYGGGVHLSKDRLQLADGQVIFGQVVEWTKNGWHLPSSPIYVKSLSQEHGTIAAPVELLAKVQIGDLLGILPVHSCMAADLMKRYITLRGEWIEMMPKY